MTDARQLLGAGHAGGAGADHGHALAGLVGRGPWLHPAVLEGLVDDGAFNALDADRVVVDVQGAGFLAGRRADAAGELREVVGGMQHLAGTLPLAAIHQVVPVGNQVIDRATLVAEGYAAIHAARTLGGQRLITQGNDEFLEVLDALFHRCIATILARELHEARRLAHYLPPTAAASPADCCCACFMSSRARR